MARISDQTYINAYIRQEGLCAVCGEALEYSPAEAHHMLRVADGGSNSDDNIVILCDREEHLYMHGGDFREPVMTTPDDYPYFTANQESSNTKNQKKTLNPVPRSLMIKPPMGKTTQQIMEVCK